MISSPIKTECPRIAILGRPNVGKSTLFNRLVGKRRAITDATPGVTRDAVEKVCILDGIKVLLIDTGGFTLTKDDLNQQVVKKSLQMVKNADVALLLCDAHETTGEDLSFVELLRPFTEKIILVVNKVDDPIHDVYVYDKYKWGFKTIVGISAEHGRNMETLKKQILSLIDTEKADRSEVHEQEIKLSILGKPNTGKSTLLNKFLGEEKAIVSEVPGTTRDVIEGRFIYKDKLFRVLDTAGIRRKKKVKEAVEYYSVNRAIGSIEESDVVCMLVDAEQGLTEQDKKICMLVIKKGKGLILALNKWDLLKKVPNQLQAYTDRIRFLFPVMDFLPVLPLSAKQESGIDSLLQTVIKVWNSLNRRVETALLNKYVGEWTSTYPIPGKKGRMKIRYATQVSVNPLRFVFFLNSLQGYPQSYTQYLKNRIRKDLGFPNVPLIIELKKAARNQL
ncbi:MAG: ribosome biogenesis GTPase Der [Spirochaetales bacterium]|nr:ribosome biogenesis GTPase Der [Spirochaetales bacterium]